jgi:hypothetical protein
MAARKNGSKMIAGFVSGITGGLLFIMLLEAEFTVWAKLELLNVEAPATIRIIAPVAKALRRRFRKLE